MSLSAAASTAWPRPPAHMPQRALGYSMPRRHQLWCQWSRLHCRLWPSCSWLPLLRLTSSTILSISSTKADCPLAPCIAHTRTRICNSIGGICLRHRCRAIGQFCGWSPSASVHREPRIPALAVDPTTAVATCVMTERFVAGVHNTKVVNNRVEATTTVLGLCTPTRSCTEPSGIAKASSSGTLPKWIRTLNDIAEAPQMLRVEKLCCPPQRLCDRYSRRRWHQCVYPK